MEAGMGTQNQYCVMITNVLQKEKMPKDFCILSGIPIL